MDKIVFYQAADGEWLIKATPEQHARVVRGEYANLSPKQMWKVIPGMPLSHQLVAAGFVHGGPLAPFI